MKKFIEKAIEYGLYLFVFILPWQTRLIIKEGTINEGYSEYLSYSLYASDILLLVLLALFFIHGIKRKDKQLDKRKTFLWVSIGLLDLVIFVSLFVADNHVLAIYKYLNFLLAVGLFAVISTFAFDKLKFFVSLSLAVFIQSAIGIYQFLGQDSLSSKWLGMARHIPYDAGVSAVEALGNLGFFERWMRAYGALPHPNMLGGFLVASLLLIIAFRILKKKSLAKAEESHEVLVSNFKNNIFNYLIILTASIALFFSFSRSAWLAFLAFIALFLFIAVMKKDLLAQKYFLPILLYSLVTLFLVSFPFTNLLEARIESKGRIEGISVSERKTSTEMAKEVIKDNWLMGVGMGNYVETIDRDYVQDEKSYYYQPTHNAFLLILAELGVFGLMAFVLTLATIFFASVTPEMVIYRLPLFVALIVLLSFDHWLWSLHFGVLYFWLFLGITYKAFAKEDISQQNDG